MTEPPHPPFAVRFRSTGICQKEFRRGEKLGVIAYNPLMSGLLTGKHSRGMAAPGSRLADSPEYRQRYWSEENFNAAEECRKIAEKAGMTPVELALRWCAHQPGIDSVLLGASRESHLTPNMSAILGPPLPKDMAEACDQVWAHMSVGTRYRYYR